jgi:hypothetical protein
MKIFKPDTRVKDAWIVAKGQYDGHDIIVRWNDGLKKVVGSGDYLYRLGLAVPFKKPRADGFPGQKEFDLLGKIEDRIVEYYVANNQGVLSVAITTNGMKEFLIYSKQFDMSQLVEMLYLSFPSHEIQHYAQLDIEWDGYKEWVSP